MSSRHRDRLTGMDASGGRRLKRAAELGTVIDYHALIKKA